MAKRRQTNTTLTTWAEANTGSHHHICFIKDIPVLLYEGFKKLIFSLPKIIFTERNPETYVPLTKLISGLDSNNSKTFFFQRLPRLYKSSDWNLIATTWFKDIQIILQARDTFIEQIRNLTKNALNRHDAQLGVCIAKWKKTLPF